MIPLTKGQKAARRAITRDRIARQRIKNGTLPARQRKAGLARPRRLARNPRQARARNSNGQGLLRTMGTGAPAAVSIKGMRVGMSDVLSHTISWLTGFIYVGNNTLGANDGIYFVDPTKSDTVLKNVPVVGSDSFIGASYISDMEKHYARKRIRRCKLTLLPLFPATSNSMTVIVAPERGPTGSYQSAIQTDTTAANLYTNVLSMNGAKQCSSWEELNIDMTPYIAGGSGAAQNEFVIDELQGHTSIEGSSDVSALGVVPCTFSVSGNNGTTALRGTTTHAVVITQVVDLLDFIGGQVDPDPESIAISVKDSIFHKIKSVSTDEKVDSLSLSEEYKTFLAFKEHHANLHEIKSSEIEIEDDYDSVPTTIISNNNVKLNPRALEFKSGNLQHVSRIEECALPKSESFISQVKELITARAERK